jgi:hypothetical protein
MRQYDAAPDAKNTDLTNASWGSPAGFGIADDGRRTAWRI